MGKYDRNNIFSVKFFGVNFLVMFNTFGHIHSVILNHSSDYSSLVLPKKHLFIYLIVAYI